MKAYRRCPNSAPTTCCGRRAALSSALIPPGTNVRLFTVQFPLGENASIYFVTLRRVFFVNTLKVETWIWLGHTFSGVQISCYHSKCFISSKLELFLFLCFFAGENLLILICDSHFEAVSDPWLLCYKEKLWVRRVKWLWTLCAAESNAVTFPCWACWNVSCLLIRKKITLHCPPVPVPLLIPPCVPSPRPVMATGGGMQHEPVGAAGAGEACTPALKRIWLHRLPRVVWRSVGLALIVNVFNFCVYLRSPHYAVLSLPPPPHGAQSSIALGTMLTSFQGNMLNWEQKCGLASLLFWFTESEKDNSNACNVSCILAQLQWIILVCGIFTVCESMTKIC